MNESYYSVHLDKLSKSLEHDQSSDKVLEYFDSLTADDFYLIFRQSQNIRMLFGIVIHKLIVRISVNNLDIVLLGKLDFLINNYICREIVGEEYYLLYCSDSYFDWKNKNLKNLHTKRSHSVYSDEVFCHNFKYTSQIPDFRCLLKHTALIIYLMKAAPYSYDLKIQSIPMNLKNTAYDLYKYILQNYQIDFPSNIVYADAPHLSQYNEDIYSQSILNSEYHTLRKILLTINETFKSNEIDFSDTNNLSMEKQQSIIFKKFLDRKLYMSASLYYSNLMILIHTMTKQYSVNHDSRDDREKIIPMVYSFTEYLNGKLRFDIYNYYNTSEYCSNTTDYSLGFYEAILINTIDIVEWLKFIKNEQLINMYNIVSLMHFYRMNSLIKVYLHQNKNFQNTYGINHYLNFYAIFNRNFNANRLNVNNSLPIPNLTNLALIAFFANYAVPKFLSDRNMTEYSVIYQVNSTNIVKVSTYDILTERIFKQQQFSIFEIFEWSDAGHITTLNNKIIKIPNDYIEYDFCKLVTYKKASIFIFKNNREVFMISDNKDIRDIDFNLTGHLFHFSSVIGYNMYLEGKDIMLYSSNNGLYVTERLYNGENKIKISFQDDSDVNLKGGCIISNFSFIDMNNDIAVNTSSNSLTMILIYKRFLNIELYSLDLTKKKQLHKIKKTTTLEKDEDNSFIILHIFWKGQQLGVSYSLIKNDFITISKRSEFTVDDRYFYLSEVQPLPESHGNGIMYYVLRVKLKNIVNDNISIASLEYVLRYKRDTARIKLCKGYAILANKNDVESKTYIVNCNYEIPTINNEKYSHSIKNLVDNVDQLSSEQIVSTRILFENIHIIGSSTIYLEDSIQYQSTKIISATRLTIDKLFLNWYFLNKMYNSIKF